MLYKIIIDLIDHVGFLNIFRYITCRIGCALFTSFLIVILLMPRFIKKLKSIQAVQPIRKIGPDHKAKSGTPTMGGLIISISIIVSVLLWTNLKNGYILTLLGTIISFTLIGFFDDYRKITKKDHFGFRGKVKIIIEFIITFFLLFFVRKYYVGAYPNSLFLPIFKDLAIYLGIFYIIFCAFVVVGSSNAVNMTDGLDGLVTIPIIMVTVSFMTVSYLIGNVNYASYLHLQYIKDTAEIAVFCGAIIGASLGFLWFNAQPAEIFMGDSGSLPIGATLGMISVITKNEILLFIAGGLFVIETLSVIIQVVSYKLTGKRVFLMSPIHHHFEKLGWSESKIVVRFWIIAFGFNAFSLFLLKIR